MDQELMSCIGCGKSPNDIDEYIEAAEENGMTPCEYVALEEGTYDKFVKGKYYCTDCYVDAGMPLIEKTPVYIPPQITCCNACSWGTNSITPEEIELQTAKHGEYICLKCEERFERILNLEGELVIGSGARNSETLITADTIYYFESDRGKIIAPGSPFMGFGGSWVLITKEYKQQYGTIRKAFVSNNLFHHCSIPKVYRKRFREAKKINATVSFIEKSQLAALRDLLSNLSYLN